MHWAALRSFGEYESNEAKQNNLVARKWFSEPYDGLDGCVLGVSLHATDEQLIADFTKWLKQKRLTQKTKPSAKGFTSKDFKKWHSYQLLAYCDLSFWAELEGVSISAEAMTDVLFPSFSELTPTEVIKRQREWIKKIINKTTRDALALQCGRF